MTDTRDQCKVSGGAIVLQYISRTVPVCFRLAWFLKSGCPLDFYPCRDASPNTTCAMRETSLGQATPSNESGPNPAHGPGACHHSKSLLVAVLSILVVLSENL